jgi:cytochrome b
MTVALQRVRVWDLPTRLFHWVLALAILGLVVTAKVGGNAIDWHFRLGYLVFTLLAFRLLWGLVGGRWSRFASFVYGPRSVFAHLRGADGPNGRFTVGHSPLGALSVFALLAVLLLQVATGLVADDEIASTGPLNRFVAGATASLATGWHKSWGQWLVIGLALLHIAAVLFYLWVKRANLIVPMLSGDKALPMDTPASADTARTRALAAVLLAVCALGVGWLVKGG